jgi:hypothetical protein
VIAMQSDESTALKWGQHPLISAVLWALGTTETHVALGEDANRLRSASSSAAAILDEGGMSGRGSTSSSKEHISWKDHQGGDIHEFQSLSINHSVREEGMGTERTATVSVAVASSSHTRSEQESKTTAIELHTHLNTKKNSHHNIYAESISLTNSKTIPSAQQQALSLPTRRFDAFEAAQTVGKSVDATAAGDLVLSSPSPNWGFFVSMTPEQQEVFAHKSTVNVNVQHPPFAR